MNRHHPRRLGERSPRHLAMLTLIVSAFVLLIAPQVLPGRADAAAPNPPLAQSCGVDMILVLDTSTSIDNTELGKMRAAFVGFVNAFLPATPTMFSVMSFDDTATTPSAFSNNVSSLTSIINSTDGSGYTNWEDALLKARTHFQDADPRPGIPNVIVFASDGNPTASSAGPNTTTQPNNHLAPAIAQADLAKQAGIRIITLGISDGGGGPNSANLQAISSADAYHGANFDTLAQTLKAIAEAQCGGTITVEKVIDADGNPATTGDQSNGGSGWQYQVNVTSNGSVASTNPNSTGSDSKVNFGLNFTNPSNDITVSVTETPQDGYSLVGVACTVNGSPLAGTSVNGNTVSGVKFDRNDTVNCKFYNTPQPTLKLIKNVVNDNGGTAQASAWTLNAAPGFSGPGSASGTTYTVTPGTYTLSETGGPAGYNNGTFSCTGGGTFNAGAQTITLALGQSATCTVTNNDIAPSLTLIKNVIREHGDAPVVDANGFGLSIGGTSVNSGQTLSVNANTPIALNEVGHPAYEFVSITGDNCPSTLGGTVTLALDQHVTCTITNQDIDVQPTIEVTKTANPTSVPETGGPVTYTVGVKNTSSEPVTLTSLVDDKFGDLNGQGTCATGGSIAVDATYTCTFTKTISGNVGDSHNNIVTAIAKDDENNEATDNDNETVTFTNVPPTVDVTKTANPTSVPETGANVTFSIVVKNTSVESVTLTSLVDDVFGNLNGLGTCVIGGTLNPSGEAGDTYTCSFTEFVGGDTAVPHKNTVTVVVTDDDDSTATDEDDETVTFTNVPPTIDVTKTANPTSLPEPGGPVTYTVTVKNTSFEDVTLTSLVDDKFGNLNGQGTCALGGTITPDATYSCEFTIANVQGDVNAPHKNIVTAVVTDNDDSTATDDDDETVTFTDVLPTITVDKSANPTSVPETGGSVTYTVEIVNTSVEAVTLTSLVDDKFGDLNGKGTCATGGSLSPNGQAGDTYTCTFTETVSGNVGETHTNVITAIAKDNENNEAKDDDDADVTFTDVLPTVEVTKTANPSSLPEPGGNVTYTIVVKNTSGEPVTLTSLVDDKFGDLLDAANPALVSTACALPQSLAKAGEAGDSYSCTFVATINGNAYDTHDNVVTVVVTDDEQNEATDDDDERVTITNVPPTVDVTKTAGVEFVTTPGENVEFTVVITNTSFEAVTLTSLTDDVYGDILDAANPAIVSTSCVAGVTLAPAGEDGDSITCTFVAFVTGTVEEPHTNEITVVVTDDDDTTGTDKDDETVEVREPANPQVGKVPSSLSVQQGGTLTYQVEAFNNGGQTATGVTLTDTLTGGTIVSISDGTDTTYDCEAVTSGTTFTCTIGDLPVNTPVTFTVTVLANTACEPINNVATIASTGGGNASTDDDAAQAQQVTVTDCVVDVAGAKTQRIGSSGGFSTATRNARVGDTIEYRLNLSNAGDQPLTGISLTDTAPNGTSNLQIVNDPQDRCDIVGRTLVCSALDLNEGQNYQVTIRVTIESCGIRITNRAFLASDQTNEESSNAVQVVVEDCDEPEEPGTPTSTPTSPNTTPTPTGTAVPGTPTPSPTPISEVSGVRTDDPSQPTEPRISEVLPSRLPSTGSGGNGTFSELANSWLPWLAAPMIAAGFGALFLSRRKSDSTN